MKGRIYVGMLIALGALESVAAAEKWSTLEVSDSTVRTVSGDKSVSASSVVQYSSLTVVLKFKKAVKWYQIMVGSASGEIDCTLLEWRTPRMSGDRKKVEIELFPGAGGCKEEVYLRWEE